ncbi:MAG: MBL fold metallo-hydrolase [Actinomycetota bacterium]
MPDGFEVIVLGASGTFPTAEQPATGFLLRSGKADVWLDAGPGTFMSLQRHSDYFALQALVISHLHLDHITDVYPFYYGLRYSIDSRGALGLPVYAPAGARKHLEQIVGGDGFGKFFDFRTVSAGDKAEIGPFSFDFHKSRHPIECNAMKIRAAGRVLVYTADSGPSDDLAGFAQGADVLIAEASMQEPSEGLENVHMTAGEAGDMAAKAGAGRLVLTHIVPGLDSDVSVEQARSRFGGEVIAATRDLRLQV